MSKNTSKKSNLATFFYGKTKCGIQYAEVPDENIVFYIYGFFTKYKSRIANSRFRKVITMPIDKTIKHTRPKKRRNKA